MRRFRGAVIAAACALAAVACGSTPAATVTTPTPTARPTASATTVTPSAPAAYKLTTGVDLYVTSDYSLAATTAMGERDIPWIASALKVGAIGIAFDLTIPSDTSDQVDAAGAATPAVADIAELTRIAQAYHLQVQYRILFRVNGSDGSAEKVNPASQAAWFSSLEAAEEPYLELAQNAGVSQFIAGTEVATIEGSTRWTAFFTWARSLYKGTLSYAAWGGSPSGGGYFSARRKLPGVSLYGVTAYPNIYLPDTATVAQLTAAWTKFLDIAPADVLARTEIDELGIPAEAGAYSAPWAWNNQHGVTDDQVQGNWFTAACDAAKAARVPAIYFWNVNLDDDPADPSQGLTNIEGRAPGEAAIRGCS